MRKQMASEGCSSNQRNCLGWVGNQKQRHMVHDGPPPTQAKDDIWKVLLQLLRWWKTAVPVKITFLEYQSGTSSIWVYLVFGSCCILLRASPGCLEFLRVYLALPCNSCVITVHSHLDIILVRGVASRTDRKIKIFLIANNFQNR